MHLATYHISPLDVTGKTLVLRESEAHHVKVNRHQPGDRIIVSDGCGTSYDCTIAEIQSGGIRVTIDNVIQGRGETTFRLTLAIAMPKKDKFEWLIEKGTEIGILNFVPLLTERTIMNNGSLNRTRCARIALAAMKQCGRSISPEISNPISFREFIDSGSGYELRIMAHEGEQKSDIRTSALSTNSDVPPRTGLICIGPEGGFTRNEVDSAEEAGFSIVSLGPRRLRSETAAIVASALLFSAFGELG